MYLLSEAAKPKPKKQVDLFGGDEDSDLFAESKPQQQPPKKKVRHISIITNDRNVSYFDVVYLLCLKWINTTGNRKLCKRYTVYMWLFLQWFYFCEFRKSEPHENFHFMLCLFIVM